jgi:DNA-binding NtrC family response regulator
MSVLIIENDPDLGQVWRRYIQRQNLDCELVQSQSDAIDVLQTQDVCVVILNLSLKDGSSIAVTDYIAYRYPKVKVILVTSDRFFSDGSIFNVVASVSAMVGQETPPEDLAAIVEYHAS